MYLNTDFDWYDLGYYFLHEVYCVQIPDCLDNYIDYESYGKEFNFYGYHEYGGGIVEIRR